MSQRPVYAALDLGSNSCRMLALRLEHDGTTERVEAYSRITRLSQGVSTTGYISPEAKERALSTLRICLKRLEKYQGNVRFQCVATEVCRRAKNAQEFLDTVQRETGLSFQVITAEREAYLSVLGLRPLFDPLYSHVLTFDVGGASTEVVLIDNHQKEIIDWISIPMGVVSVLETHNPERRSNYARVVRDISKPLEAFSIKNHLDPLIAHHRVQLIGASGTATTAASIHLGLRYYDRDRIDGHRMSLEDIEKVVKHLQMMTIQERSNHPCIGADRADLVLGGMAIFQGLSRILHIHEITVADRGVRDGLLQEMIQKDLAMPSPSF